MPDTIGEEAGRASVSKRPRETPESYRFPPPKRSKINQDPATPTESTVGYDACPMPRVADYFYEDLIPKAPELSQVFPTLCHDAHVVRRWLGSDGCAIYWKAVMEGTDNTTNAPKLPHHLAGPIARSLTKLRNPQSGSHSPKFHALCEALRSHLGLGDVHRIVVFMRHDAVARVIVRMLMDRVHDGVRPMLAQDYGDQLTKAKEAVEHGKSNVLVTTQLPVVLTLRAPVLIMFDELPCHLTQVLCRGATTDHLVRMVERGRLQDTKFSHPTPSDAAAREWMTKVIKLGGAIPPPSIYIHPSTESPPPLSTDRRLRDTTTAAWLSPSDALTVIHLILQERSKFGFGFPGQCSVYLSERDGSPRYVCGINIPGFKTNHKIEEYGHSKLEALVSGCLSACRLLQMSGLLEPAHFPAVYPFVPNPRAIEPQQSKKAKSSGVRTHPRRTPLFWSLPAETPRGLWHPTVVFIDGLMGEFGLLAILTRHPLPAISDFPFFSGKPTDVRLRKCQPGLFSQDELEKLRRATLRILRYVGNKPFVGNLNQLPYLLFPLVPEITLLNSLREPYWAHEGHPRLGSPCASEVVMSMAASAFLPITTDSTKETIKDLDDAVIQDRKVEYTKHYFVDKIREDLTPLHKPQEGERQYGHESYLEHCKARVKDFQGIKNLDQPLVEVKVAPGIINRLDLSPKPQTTEKSAPQTFIPELCVKSTVPASIARTALTLPPIMTKIDEILLVKELNARMFDNVIREDLLREALTPPTAEAESNYERLEILGDAILKYLISCHVFMHDFSTQSHLHAHRRDIINNKTLYQHAVNAELPQFILSKRFSVKTWYPASISVRSSFNLVPNDEMLPTPDDKSAADPGDTGYAVHKDAKTHQLGDKALADVVEAILGAAYLSVGFPGVYVAAQSFAIPVLEYDVTSDIGQRVLPEPPAEVSPLLGSGTMQALEGIIGHKFRRVYYLVQVLANKTAPQYQSTSCERLGFIGDGILDFLTIRYLYEREPNLAPGSLTLLKCAMVSNSALAALCVKCGIHQLVDTRAYGISNVLNAYVSAVTTALWAEQRASSREGRPHGQYWLRLRAPKALSDVMEGILGALYVSDNCTLEGTEKFFSKVFKPFFDEFVTFEMLAHHAADAVLEMLNRLGCRQYSRVHNVENGVHSCKIVWHGNTLCEAQDTNFDVAMQKASEKCLQILTEKPKLLRDACNCLTTQPAGGTKPGQKRK